MKASALNSVSWTCVSHGCAHSSCLVNFASWTYSLHFLSFVIDDNVVEEAADRFGIDNTVDEEANSTSDRDNNVIEEKDGAFVMDNDVIEEAVGIVDTDVIIDISAPYTSMRIPVVHFCSSQDRRLSLSVGSTGDLNEWR